jgi:hypothetical protein
MVIERNIRKHNFLRGGPEWVIIYGTKGEGFINPGYVWVPYIMSVDPVVEESPPTINTLNISSRYWKSLNTINNGYYSTMTL